MAKTALATIGEQYGRLTATGRTALRPRSDGRNRLEHEWNCECGGTTWQALRTVRSGNTTSCGCFHREIVSAPITHGRSRTHLYKRWKAIKTRCENKNFPGYKFYGAKGIRLCDEWQDFSTFQRWAVDHGYVEGLQLDRRDPDGDYTPDNCRYIDARSNILRAKRGLGRLGLPDDLDLRLREQAALERIEPTELIQRAVEAYLSV